MKRLFQFCTKIHTPTSRSVPSEAVEKSLLTGFQRLDFRIGNIVQVDKQPQSETLYWLKIDMGKDKETMLVAAGLQKYFKIEEMTGHVVVLVNMKKRKFAGIESHGMIIFAKNDTTSDLIRPVGQVGDKVSVKSLLCESSPFIRYQTWLNVQLDMKTNAQGVVTYKDEPFETQSGPVVSKLLNAMIR